MPGGPNPNAWNRWYHCVGSTYGAWLRGDPRGFRTHRHGFHVEGDYRNPPPPGVYAPMFAWSRKRMKHPPTKLTPEQRAIVCRAMIERLERDEAEVIALAVAVNHFHLLARFAALDASAPAESILQDGRDPAPRHYLGHARKTASYALREAELSPVGPVWADRPKIEPIRDRAHQINVAQYIRRHTAEGAAVYVAGEGFVES